MKKILLLLAGVCGFYAPNALAISAEAEGYFQQKLTSFLKPTGMLQHSYWPNSWEQALQLFMEGEIKVLFFSKEMKKTHSQINRRVPDIEIKDAFWFIVVHFDCYLLAGKVEECQTQSDSLNSPVLNVAYNQFIPIKNFELRFSDTMFAHVRFVEGNKESYLEGEQVQFEVTDSGLKAFDQSYGRLARRFLKEYTNSLAKKDDLVIKELSFKRVQSNGRDLFLGNRESGFQYRAAERKLPFVLKMKD